MKLGDKAKTAAIEHVKRTAARDILNGIKKWTTERVHTAKRRWIFELLQNAIDTARLRGKPNLRVEIKWDGKRLRFAHDGGFFTLDEISAVIYGGSTKPYAPESEYIGRFGTGFLVTHVVSRKVHLHGYVQDEENNLHEFTMHMDRSAEQEEHIGHAIEKCFNQLNKAKRLAEKHSELWSEFEYEVRDELGQEAVEQGLQELRKLAPLVLGFNPLLQEIRLNDEVLTVQEEQELDEQTRMVKVGERAAIIRKSEDEEVEVAILLQGKEVASLQEGYPPIFIGLPLTETADYIVLPFVMNSIQFDAGQERDVLRNTEKNKDLIKEAFGLYRSLLDDLLDWDPDLAKLFHLVQVSLIPDEHVQQNELWRNFNDLIGEVFAEIVREVALVPTNDGVLPVSETVFPRFQINGHELSDDHYGQFCRLLRRIGKTIPEEDLKEWAETAENLSEIIEELDEEVADITLTDVEGLRDEIKDFVEEKEQESGKFPTVADLAEEFGLENDEAAKNFLLELVELADALYGQNLVDEKFVEYLVPDQNGVLGPVEWDDGELAIDGGIPEEFKDIVARIGRDLRSELVDTEFGRYEVVQDFIRTTLDTASALEEIVDDDDLHPEHLEGEWDDKVRAWVDLFWWCVENLDEIPKGFPVITKANEVAALSKQRPLILPFHAMGIESEFEQIYPDAWIMNHGYFEEVREQTVENLKKKNWPFFVTDLPLRFKEAQLEKAELQSILVEGKAADGSHRLYSDHGFTDLPFWDATVGAISQSRSRARLFFRFVVTYLVPKDPSWKEPAEVECRSEKSSHKLYPCLWLMRLKSHRWVPVFGKRQGEEGTEWATVSTTASKASLEDLLSQRELDRIFERLGENYHFLTHFGFSELDLNIKRMSISQEIPEKQIRKHLAKLIRHLPARALEDLAKTRPDLLTEAVKNALEKARREEAAKENQEIGVKVEQVVRTIIEREGLKVEPKHRGLDFEISWPEPEEGWDSGAIEIDPYLMEVKFTSTNRARLSATQAQEARIRKDHYVVLVVENADYLRELLTEIEEEVPEEVIARVVENSHIIENIYEKLGEMPNPDEIEPDITGYWLKERLWSRGKDLLEWLRETFS